MTCFAIEKKVFQGNLYLHGTSHQLPDAIPATLTQLCWQDTLEIVAGTYLAQQLVNHVIFQNGVNKGSNVGDS
jgi:hypothetical protein